MRRRLDHESLAFTVVRSVASYSCDSITHALQRYGSDSKQRCRCVGAELEEINCNSGALALHLKSLGSSKFAD